VIEGVEALDEKVVGFFNVGVQARARLEKTAGDLAFLGDLLLGEKVSGLSAVVIHVQRLAESS